VETSSDTEELTLTERDGDSDCEKDSVLDVCCEAVRLSDSDLDVC